MRTSDLLATSWSVLKHEEHSLPGLYERRICSDSIHSIFAGIVSPSNLVQLCLEVTIGNSHRIAEQEAKGFRLRREYRQESGRARLQLELTNIMYHDMFLVVSTDILGKILEAPDEQQSVIVLQQRLEHWKRFMQSAGPDGLSRTQQIGLFGELLVLRELLRCRYNNDVALASWQGPKGENQDFIHGDHALEVKTTSSNERTKVSISNEYQLDSLGLSLLTLCHVRVEERVLGGRTLPSLVDEISGVVTPSLAAIFVDRLVEAGYHDSQRDLYADNGFVERERTYYLVTKDFPKIIPSDLPLGVSEVRYQLDLSAANPLNQLEREILESYLENKA